MCMKFITKKIRRCTSYHTTPSFTISIQFDSLKKFFLQRHSRSQDKKKINDTFDSGYTMLYTRHIGDEAC